MGYLLILGSRPLISLLNIIFAGLSSPGTTGVDLICSRAIFTLALVSKQFFIVLFITFYRLLLVHSFSDHMMMIWLVHY